MKNKRKSVSILVIIIVLVITGLWISGIIPKQIAKISSKIYLEKNFPEIQLRYEKIEWTSKFGDYIITYIDNNDELHSFCIGPKFFPINLGQGLFEFQEKYEKIKNTLKNGEKFEISYSQRTDKKLKTIVDKNQNSKYDYNVYTFGGDVSITINDKMYSLEDAIQQNLITANDIVEQAKIDSKSGICKENSYYDGGSKEYEYSNYTILKYNTLFDEKDLVIGIKGKIMDKVKEILNR